MHLRNIAIAILILITFSNFLCSQELLVVGGNYFDVQEKKFVKNEGIAIKDGVFSAMGKNATNLGIKKRIELKENHFILPGFIDLHAHYNVRLFKKRREEFTVIPAIYLANGATVTFSAGEYDPDGMQKLRQQIESEEKIGPRLINSGPYFGRVRRDWGRDRTNEQIRKDVDLWAPKVGGFKAKQIRPEHLKVLIDAAHKHNLTVTGHLGSGYRNSVNPRDAIEMGIDRIEHFLGGKILPKDKSAYRSLAELDPANPKIANIIRLYVEKKVWFDATITAYGYFGDRGEEFNYWIDEREFFTEFVREQLKDKKRRKIESFEKIYQLKQKTIKQFFDAGGLITMGTDHFSDGDYLPGFGIHRELDALVRSGIPAADVLKIATINGARALKIDKLHGSISVGKSGDLYIVKGNPIKQVRNTRNGVFVVRAGKKYIPKELFEKFKGELGPKSESEKSDW